MTQRTTTDTQPLSEEMERVRRFAIEHLERGVGSLQGDVPVVDEVLGDLQLGLMAATLWCDCGYDMGEIRGLNPQDVYAVIADEDRTVARIPTELAEEIRRWANLTDKSQVLADLDKLRAEVESA